MRCAAIRETLHREAAALDEAQRLLLDDHLADCAECRRDRDRLLAVHRIGAAVESKLDARAHQRAIARALLEGPRSVPTAPERRRWVPIAAFAVAAAAIALVIAWRLREPSEELAALAPPATAPAPAQAPDAARTDELVVENPEVVIDDVVEDGALSAASGAVAAGAAVPARTLLRAPVKARVRLASAVVIVAASSELRWQPVDRTILLERGRLDIASGPNGIARVVAGRVEVDLGDAEVTVEPGAVRVQRGTVHVRHDKRTVRLTAGNAWTLEVERARGTDELLAEARKKFAARDFAGAERAASAAVATRPPPAIAASARTLLADIALARNDLDRAVERYLAVANDYAGTPVAESALYAAARTELRRANTAAARALLARYLERYPAGRYADDVRRQLAAPKPTE